jgi:hypothetical protein
MAIEVNRLYLSAVFGKQDAPTALLANQIDLTTGISKSLT